MSTISLSTVSAKLRLALEYFTLRVSAARQAHLAMLPKKARISGRISSTREKELKDAVMSLKLAFSVLSSS